jgi:hypothetical protein
METKTCNQCGVEKALAEFYKSATGADGYRSQCKKCHCANVMKRRDRKAYNTYMKDYMSTYKK